MDSLWIETGEMSGGSRNQIEFDEELASFFAGTLPATGASETLALSINGGRWQDCELTAKVTTFDVRIYRLGLVTAAQGGDVYPGRVVRFERAQGRYFNVHVVDINSSSHIDWRSQSAANSTLSRTSGPDGREFGFF